MFFFSTCDYTATLFCIIPWSQVETEDKHIYLKDDNWGTEKIQFRAFRMKTLIQSTWSYNLIVFLGSSIRASPWVQRCEYHRKFSLKHLQHQFCKKRFQSYNTVSQSVSLCILCLLHDPPCVWLCATPLFFYPIFYMLMIYLFFFPSHLPP